MYIKNSFFSFDLFVSGKQTLRPGLERRSTTCRAVMTAATTSRKTTLEKLTSLGGLYLPHIFITMVLWVYWSMVYVFKLSMICVLVLCQGSWSSKLDTANRTKLHPGDQSSNISWWWPNIDIWNLSHLCNMYEVKNLANLICSVFSVNRVMTWYQSTLQRTPPKCRPCSWTEGEEREVDQASIHAFKFDLL